MKTLLIISTLLLTACNAGTSIGPTQCIPAESVPGSACVSGCCPESQPVTPKKCDNTKSGCVIVK